MTASLVASFVRRPAAESSGLYWVHLEQVLPEDNTASLGEVADLVDEVYGANPCLREGERLVDQEDSEEKTGETKPPITEEQLAEIIKKQFNPRFCGMDAGGNFLAQVKVAVSHPGEHYTLRLTNGVIAKTVTVEEQFEKIFIVDNQTSVDLDFPVLGNASFSWRGSVYGRQGNMAGPEIVLAGHTLSWGGESVTGSIAASYRTRYDLVEITVFGTDDGEPGECRLICFFHGMVDEIDLQPLDIEADEDREVYRQPFCGAGQLESPESGDDVTCYETRVYEYRCQCSGSVAYTVSDEVSVDCPPGIHCQGGAKKCSSNLGTRTVLAEYVDCNESTGGLDDPEYRKKVCCDDHRSLPKCRTFSRKNSGGAVLDPDILKKYQDKYGDKLRVIEVSPPDGDCGTTKTTISVKAKKCCDEVPALEWDDELSVEVLAPESAGVVYVAGGKLPLTWAVRGQGFFVDHEHRYRDAVTKTRELTITTDETACGTCTITVNDGCSTVVGYIRATAGRWESVPSLDGQATLSGAGDTFSGFQTAWKTLGGLRMREDRGNYVNTSIIHSDPACQVFCQGYPKPDGYKNPAALTGRPAFGNGLSYDPLYSFAQGLNDNCLCNGTSRLQTEKWVC